MALIIKHPTIICNLVTYLEENIFEGLFTVLLLLCSLSVFAFKLLPVEFMWVLVFFFLFFLINPSEDAKSIFCLLASDDPGLLRFELVHCLHLCKSSVNWILLYVPESDYKCKMAWPELYVPLLWGCIPPSLFHHSSGWVFSEWEENNQ